MKFINLIYLALIFLVSCENKPDSSVQQNAPAAANPLLPLFSDSSTKSNSDAVALNPKHGEPGHRCDIAEGAPLPVTNTNIPTITTSPVAPAINSSNAETKNETPVLNAGSAGLNPKHGEPGHRCDIAVGAPLNSKPAQ